jgi:uncharacterized protein
MAMGEAAVTVLSDRGVPTPVAHTRLVAPASRMGPADDPAAVARASPLSARYGERLDARSVKEILGSGGPDRRLPALAAGARAPAARRPRAVRAAAQAALRHELRALKGAGSAAIQARLAT